MPLVDGTSPLIHQCLFLLWMNRFHTWLPTRLNNPREKDILLVSKATFISALSTTYPSTQLRTGYSTSIKSYIHFCLIHNLPLNPTPQNLAHYIAYVSQYINSAPQYLSGIRHFLLEFFPDFNDNRSSTLVQATIRGSKKVWCNVSIPAMLELIPRHSGLQTSDLGPFGLWTSAPNALDSSTQVVHEAM